MTRPKFLIVDKGDRNHPVMQDALENEDCDVFSAATTADALNLIVTHNFDVIIIDLQVPRAEDSSRLLNAAHYFQPEALIVAVSDCLTVQEVALVVRLQVDYVVKPINIKEIVELSSMRTVRPNFPTISDLGLWLATQSKRPA